MFAYLNVQLIIPMDLYGKERWDGDLMPLATDATRHDGPAPLLADTYVSPCGAAEESQSRQA